MRYPSRFVICLPLLLLPALTVPALAQVEAAEQAVLILSRAKSIDSRCNILSASERSELTRYTARAEIAAASQVSASAARAANDAGAAQAKSAGCSAQASADVRETLVAARTAIAAIDAREPKRQKIEAAPEKPVRTKREPVEGDELIAVPRGNLKSYASSVRGYYVERRCRHLPDADARRYWNAIVRFHKSVVRAHGASRVAPVMRDAERAASRVACGNATLALVKQGFAQSLRR